jgi:hypothetical protein
LVSERRVETISIPKKVPGIKNTGAFGFFLISLATMPPRHSYTRNLVGYEEHCTCAV